MIGRLLQGSTVRGLAVIASMAAAVAGYGDVFAVELSEGGALQIGGAVGVVVTAGVGFYDVVRDEYKTIKSKIRGQPWTRY